ncbi:MAG: hypothetical protein L0I76_14165 [Pseudonocardia sp.]|nr:hypothetical protein [Pseudonocardia sp.]
MRASPRPRPTSSPSRRVPALAALLVALLALVSCSSGSSSQPTSAEQASARAVDLSQGWTWRTQPRPTEIGVTHTQNSLDATEPTEARERGKQILTGSGEEYQNHHLMGFGTLNPEPSPGEYDWSSLDRRMELTKETDGKPMMTLCCAPDWMKGGEPGDTDWSKLEKAPDPEHYGDYAELAAEAVKRYPQVDRVMVWNEFKGFYNQDENRWDYEGYTTFYNEVYKAVKAARPDIKVGGPYVVTNSVPPGSSDASDVTGVWGALDERPLDALDYWLKNNVGADFITVDGSTTNKGVQDAISPVDVGAQKFAVVNDWIKQRSDLPIWWAEFYANVPAGAEAGYDSQASAVSTLAAISAMARSGAGGALLWGPEGSSDLDYSSLWTPATESDGGQPTPLTEAWKWLVPRLQEGNVEFGRAQGSPLSAFRDADGNVLMVNLSGDPVPVPDQADIPGWAIVEVPSST